ncbi:hypothetical protein SUGI_1033720 [Cryptomeria japonica]|nr:hypothetical protein SUGI_1033720 [Cryptomeria japonica]
MLSFPHSIHRCRSPIKSPPLNWKICQYIKLISTSKGICPEETSQSERISFYKVNGARSFQISVPLSCALPLEQLVKVEGSVSAVAVDGELTVEERATPENLLSVKLSKFRI